MPNDHDHHSVWESYPKEPSDHPKQREGRCSVTLLVSLLCVAVALTLILTSTITSAYYRGRYAWQLAVQEQIIQAREREIAELEKILLGGDAGEFEKLQFVATLFDYYAYYADTMDDEAVRNAVIKAFVEATGDRYAAYYTEEEYQALLEEDQGNSTGIGVSIVQDVLTVEGVEYRVFRIIAIYSNSPAAATELRVGDCIYSVKTDKGVQTISDIGGYNEALAAMKGDAGTQAEFSVFREETTGYSSIPFSITRDTFVMESVSYTLSETDPKVGVIRLMEFDLTTPTQLKNAVNSLVSLGAERFVFDVRNNPGGSLRSILAVLTYFLDEGDLILSAIDKDGTVVTSYYASEQNESGIYASCNVSREEIGMYKDLDMVILCNGNTASAAEVFTAALRDHNSVPIIGETTFGKGIMQTYFSLSRFSGGAYDGWLKMTTYAYVTECGVTYHDIGIQPDQTVTLSDEAKQQSLYTLPESMDDQLRAAIAHVNQ